MSKDNSSLTLQDGLMRLIGGRVIGLRGTGAA
jgi:hypothetical protein